MKIENRLNQVQRGAGFGYMIKKSDVALYYARVKKYPDKQSLFRPSETYPEYLFQEDVSTAENGVYDAVRESFHLCAMDEEKYGTSEWNPLGTIIKPGDHVLIKPNMVMDTNPSGEGTDCLYTHPSVVAAIIDYVLIALKGQGQIAVGDAPMQECDFEKLIAESGYAALMDFYDSKGIRIKLLDFRELKTNVHFGARHQHLTQNSEGTVIDLGDESEFAACTKDELDNLRITNYAPDRLKSHHCPGKHEYYISNHVLDANVVINVPKPKTHRKAGVTIALKNMVGINVRKEYLPHHTMGSQEEGGDEYARKSMLRRISSKMYDLKNMHEGAGKFMRARFFFVLGGGLKYLSQSILKDQMEGSWHGNRTISKTIADLNKILLYADKQGKLCSSIQRKVLNVADMIISGEKEGPVVPSPKPLGIIAVGFSSVNFDMVVGAMMGADIRRIPALLNAENIHGALRIKPDSPPQIVSNNINIHGRTTDELPESEKWNFVCSKGWKSVFMQEYTK